MRREVAESHHLRVVIVAVREAHHDGHVDIHEERALAMGRQ